ncbi:beta-lactamase domain-containing protein [Clostridium sp. DL-VIII]|uniref:MBL fold metallo-hydrolase n=1 Tax=Clostridium sp. DL-VIII TaxID=641107 RepID=UPI00023B00B0|nr:MBL fold metallo-hydrolase [Clostridium sp. DL-VIII]EHI98585.1 beta-lactamase domain-containing protein [Clostridium sp. DL-VIII]
MTMIFKDLHQFSTHVKQINLSFHQYLLLGEDPILFHTGNAMQAEIMLPELKVVLGDRNLKYIFVSHFESDECGGLSVILKEFPKAKVICSAVTARQLDGFGINAEVIVKKPAEILRTNDYELEFIRYPSEMHLWDGLLVMENNRGIFFSSDLMISFGEEIGTVKESDWNTEINNIKLEQVPDSEKLKELQQALLKLNPNFVATGHGICLKTK